MKLSCSQTGAEDNLLKLAELRGNITSEESSRWQQIKKDFLRNKAMGGDNADVGGKVVAQLVDLVNGVQKLSDVASQAATSGTEQSGNSSQALAEVVDKLTSVVKTSKPSIKIINEPVPGIDKVLTVLAETIEHSIFPLVRSMDKKLDIDLRTHEKMQI